MVNEVGLIIGGVTIGFAIGFLLAWIACIKLYSVFNNKISPKDKQMKKQLQGGTKE